VLPFHLQQGLTLIIEICHVEILVICCCPISSVTIGTIVVIAIVANVVVVNDRFKMMMMMMIVDGTFKVEAVVALKLDGSVEKQRFPQRKDSEKRRKK
jgi:hypothetical protein